MELGAIQLEELVASYGAHDEEAKKLKKVCDGEKEQIKNALTDGKIRECVSGGYKVDLRESTTVTMNEERMLEVLKHAWVEQNGSMQCPYIKTLEYIDTDELEAAMYAGELSKETLEELDKCKSYTTKVALYCKKVN